MNHDISDDSPRGDATLIGDEESDTTPSTRPLHGHRIDLGGSGHFDYSGKIQNGDDSRSNPAAEIRTWGGFKAMKRGLAPLANLTIPDLLRKKKALHYANEREAMHIDFFLAFLFGETKSRKVSEYRFCTLGTMPTWAPSLMSNRFWREFHTLFRGFGNMVWCNNPISGALVILAMALDHPFMMTCALLGVCGSTWTGRMLGVNPLMVDSGLYSYNGLLCGFYIALFSYQGPVFFQPWVLVNSYLVGSLSSVFMLGMSNVLAATYHVSPLSLPYILAVILFVGACYSSTYWPTGLVAEFPVPPDRDVSSLVQYDYWELLKASLKGTSVAQSVQGGLIMTGAAFICSPILAITGFLGGIIGYAACVYMGVPPDDPYFYSGMYSYNSGLSAQAMMMFLVPTPGAIVYATLCCVSVSVAQIGLVNIFKPFGLSPGTLAMNTVAIPFLLTQLSVTFVTPVPLELATIPEDHIIQYRRMKHLTATLLMCLEKRPSRSFNVEDGDKEDHFDSERASRMKFDIEKLQVASEKIHSIGARGDGKSDSTLYDKSGSISYYESRETVDGETSVRIFMRAVSRDGSLSISQDDIECALDDILSNSPYSHVELRHAIEDLWNFARKNESDVFTEKDVCTMMKVWGRIELQTRELHYLFDIMDAKREGVLSYDAFQDLIKFFPSQVCEESKKILETEIYQIFKAEATRRMDEKLKPGGSEQYISDSTHQFHGLIHAKDIKLTFGQFVHHLFGSDGQAHGMPPLE